MHQNSCKINPNPILLHTDVERTLPTRLLLNLGNIARHMGMSPCFGIQSVKLLVWEKIKLASEETCYQVPPSPCWSSLSPRMKCQMVCVCVPIPLAVEHCPLPHAAPPRPTVVCSGLFNAVAWSLQELAAQPNT